MTDSIIPHVIGTSALLIMFFTVSTYYTGFFNRLHSEAYRAQLGQVSDYLASSILDLETLSRIAEVDQFLVKDVEPPPFIGDRVYTISLITMTPSYGDTELIRVVATIDALNIYAISDLPWSLDSNVEIYTNQTVTHPYNLTLTNTLLSDAAVGRAAQIAGAASMVVWCYKADGTTIIGLGVMDRG